MKAILKRFTHSLINTVFPLRCLVCGDDLLQYEAMPLCKEHKMGIVPVERPFCDVCGKQMFSSNGLEVICQECRETKRNFDRSFSATRYTDVMKTLVEKYKYRMRDYLAAPFADLISEFIQKFVDYRKIDLVLPVPLHWRRYMYRGFNQAYEMIRHFRKEFSFEVSRGNLRRIRNTTPQVMLSPEERRENIVGAFKVIKPGEFRDKSLLLVDDVFTTGSTMNECAGALKEAGAATVTGLTLTQPVA